MRTNYLFKKKIKIIYSNVFKSNAPLKIPKEILKRYNLNWGKFGGISNLKWLQTYIRINENYSSEYVPENIYYSELEPRLNFKTYSKAFTDKNFYNLHLKGIQLPKLLLRNLNGVFYNMDYERLDSLKLKEEILKLYNRRFIIKPTIDTGGGSNVRMIYWNNDELKISPELNLNSLESIFSFYNKDFLIQEYIEQNSFFLDFNHSSLNTIRILTYRSVRDESIKIIHRVLRSGRPGMIVDNQSSGGVATGILENGVLNNFAVDKYGNKFNSINNINLSAVGKIPFIDEISEIAVEVAKQFYYSRLLGLDFCVNNHGKIFLLEVNDSNNEINFYQMTNGPLFGQFTQEIIEHCSKVKKSINLDFNI